MTIKAEAYAIAERLALAMAFWARQRTPDASYELNATAANGLCELHDQAAAALRQLGDMAEEHKAMAAALLALKDGRAELAKLREERDQLRAAINIDGSLTEHAEFVSIAKDGAHALDKLGEIIGDLDRVSQEVKHLREERERDVVFGQLQECRQALRALVEERDREERLLRAGLIPSLRIANGPPRKEMWRWTRREDRGSYWYEHDDRAESARLAEAKMEGRE